MNYFFRMSRSTSRSLGGENFLSLLIPRIRPQAHRYPGYSNYLLVESYIGVMRIFYCGKPDLPFWTFKLFSEGSTVRYPQLSQNCVQNSTRIRSSNIHNLFSTSSTELHCIYHCATYLLSRVRSVGNLYISTTLKQLLTALNKNFNPLSARIFTVFGHSLLEDRVLHKEAWVAKLLGTHPPQYPGP